MKKFQKIFAIICAIVTINGAIGLGGSCPVSAAGGENIDVMPMYVAISQTYTNLKLGSWGKLTCTGTTEVLDGYIAGVTVELQMKIGTIWTTIQTWSTSDWDYASIDQDWYVESGYNYRVKSTHYSYDSNWNQLEKVIKYSNIVSY